MATDKLFNVFGVSKHPTLGYKVRFANDIMRIKNLAKSGHEDIRLAELDAPTTKYDGIKQLQTMDEFQDAAAQSAISEYLEDKAPRAAKGPAVKAPAKAKSTKSTKATREAEALAQAKAVALEDAPF
jgi:hypothetical protein